MTDGYIYFAHMQGFHYANWFKVGFSSNPAFRAASLGSRFRPCTLLLFVPGRIEDEQAIHELLAPYSVKSEWYRPSRRLHRLMHYCAEFGCMPASVTASGDAWAARRKAIRDFKRSQEAMGSDISSVIMPHLHDPWQRGKQGPGSADLSWLPEKALIRLQETETLRMERKRNGETKKTTARK